jgi:dTDP-4-dehydrorhamnose reductase
MSRRGVAGAGRRLRWVVTGAGGQLGSCLAARLRTSDAHELAAAFERKELDVTDADAVLRALRSLPGGPADVVANAAAMTQVDRCETEPALADAVNAAAPGLLAAACRDVGAQLVHVSTDYVFDGRASHPYTETDRVAPASVYGRSKLEGERRVLAELPGALVVRSAWVFGPGSNFVRTILLAAARALRGEGPPLRVVDDQRGSPTYAADLAGALLRLVEAGGSGIYHVANAGIATWWDVARAAVDAWGHPELPIAKVTTAEFPRPAPRPAWSVLDGGRAERLGVQMRPWREALQAYLHSDASPLRELGAST